MCIKRALRTHKSMQSQVTRLYPWPLTEGTEFIEERQDRSLPIERPRNGEGEEKCLICVLDQPAATVVVNTAVLECLCENDAEPGAKYDQSVRDSERQSMSRKHLSKGEGDGLP
jgi:hypothetical protein